MMRAMAWMAAVCGLAGCSVSVEPIGIPGPPPVELPAGDGSMTINWLVGGRSNTNACTQAGARSMEVVVYDNAGRPVLRQLAACASFTLTIPLDEGRYSADVTLLDASGNPLTATRTLSAVDVIAGTDLAINIDF